MKWFSSVEFVDELPRGGPAAVNRITGKLKLSRKYWSTMEKEQKVFVLLHELGHLVLNSGDELEVDQWALKKYMEMGYSLKSAVRALTRVLSFTSREHLVRVKQQLAMLRHFDYHFNGNPNAIQWSKTE